MNQIKNHTKGLTYISASWYAVFVGMSFLATKIGVNRGSPLETLSYRFLFAFMAIFIYVKIKRIKISYKKEEIRPLLILSFLYGVSFLGFQALGMDHITTVESSIIFSLVPIITLVLATVCIKEKHNWKQYISVLLSAGGVIFIFAMKGSDGGNTSFFGITIVFVSSVSIAIQGVYIRWLRNSFSPAKMTFFMLLFGTVFYQTLLFFRAVFLGDFSSYTSRLTDFKFMVAVICVGVFSTFATSILATYGLSKLPAVKMSVFGNLAAVIAIGIGVIILGEPLKYYHIVGTILILVGVLGTNFLSTKPKS